MLKAVLDTNVLVSAFLSRSGVPNQVLRQAGQSYRLFISQVILEETDRVLHELNIQKRGKLIEEEIQDFLNSLYTVAGVVENPPSLRVIKDDPDDDAILACAVAAQVDYLVSGDVHLKRLKGYKGIRIVSPSDFPAILLPDFLAQGWKNGGFQLLLVHGDGMVCAQVTAKIRAQVTAKK